MRPWLALVLAPLLAPTLGGCFEFGGTIKKNAEAFERLHPDGLRTATVAGRSLRWAQVGDSHKPRILFIHGSPGGWDAWAGFLNDQALLAGASLSAVDRLGYGGSCHGCVVASLHEQAEALLPAIADAEGPVIVVGHSLGGPVAARLAMDYPAKVAALILVAPSIDPAQERTPWYQIVAAHAPVIWLMPSDLDVCNREIMPLKGELEAMVPLWSKLTLPVEVIQGLDDDLVPPANADFAERVLKPAQLRVTRVPSMNHFVPWAHPELIREAIARQLSALSPRAEHR